MNDKLCNYGFDVREKDIKSEFDLFATCTLGQILATNTFLYRFDYIKDLLKGAPNPKLNISGQGKADPNAINKMGDSFVNLVVKDKI